MCAAQSTYRTFHFFFQFYDLGVQLWVMFLGVSIYWVLFCNLDLLISYTLCTYAKMLLKYLFWLDNAGTCIELIRSIVGSIISNWFVTIPYGQTLLIELVLKFSQSILYILQVIFQQPEALLNNLIERLACKTQISLKPRPEVNLGQNMIQN